MKKVVFALLISLLAISLASSVDIEFLSHSPAGGGFFSSFFGSSSEREAYYPAETLQAEIPDVFIQPLTLDNFGFYQQNAVHKTPVEQGLIKSEDKYLYYAILPLATGNYSFRIENAEYLENNIQSDQPIIKNVSIVSTNESYLSFKPGYVSATSDFSIRIKSYNKAQEIKVDFKEANFSQSFNLGNGNDKTVYISIAKINAFTKANITINNYHLPVIISPGTATNKPVVEGEETEENAGTTSIPLKNLIDISPDELEAAVLPDYDYFFEIEISRETTRTLSDIELSSSDRRIKLSTEQFDLEDDEKTIRVTINTDRALEEEIEISYRNDSMKIPVTISLAKNETAVTSNTPAVNQQQTCAEMNGIQCDYLAGEECIGSKSQASDIICCVGECKIKKTSTLWIWGLVILAVLGIVGWLMYKKSKLTPPRDEKTRELLKKRAEEYEKRFEIEKPKEIRKGLAKS